METGPRPRGNNSRNVSSSETRQCERAINLENPFYAVKTKTLPLRTSVQVVLTVALLALGFNRAAAHVDPLVCGDGNDPTDPVVNVTPPCTWTPH